MSEGKERPRRGETARQEAAAEEQDATRHTERLSPNGDEWSQREPVNPGWRSERASSGRGGRRGRGGLPASPQEFQLWLQAGGWRYLAGIAALLVVLLVATLTLLRNNAGNTTTGVGQTAPTSVIGSGNSSTANVLPTTLPLPTTPPASTFFVVSGTGDGLNMRSDHNTTAAIVGTYPDGTRLEQIGEDFAGPDRVWRKVRADDGKEGWVAVDFLTPAP